MVILLFYWMANVHAMKDTWCQHQANVFYVTKPLARLMEKNVFVLMITGRVINFIKVNLTLFDSIWPHLTLSKVSFTRMVYVFHALALSPSSTEKENVNVKKTIFFIWMKNVFHVIARMESFPKMENANVSIQIQCCYLIVQIFASHVLPTSVFRHWLIITGYVEVRPDLIYR